MKHHFRILDRLSLNLYIVDIELAYCKTLLRLTCLNLAKWWSSDSSCHLLPVFCFSHSTVETSR